MLWCGVVEKLASCAVCAKGVQKVEELDRGVDDVQHWSSRLAVGRPASVGLRRAAPAEERGLLLGRGIPVKLGCCWLSLVVRPSNP